ncbi:MAG TPA: amino acid adenylation domain-containing protein [Longimicrobiaceae bacterium]|jgi:amino acid adenylation domain-containing protein
MSGISDRLAQLSPERRAALQELLRQRPSGRDAAQVPQLAPVPRDGEPLPASFAQRRLWFVQRMEPLGWAYNLSYPLRLSGGLDARALRRALTAVVRRHEALRTTLEERGGEPVQVVHPPAPVRVPAVELRGLPAGAREREARRLADAEARRPFDLARGPLLRAVVLRTGDGEAAVILTLHHVVTDGWSMEVLTREVSALYAAELRGEEARLPELPVQYADYAVWQRSWLSGETLEEQVGWWRGQLAGAPALLELPVDRPRPAVPGGAGARVPLCVGGELAAGLRALSQREGATLFMTLLAAWQLLLARYAGQDDVLVGTPIAGRNRRETEGLIGFFVNTLVLRADLARDVTFADLLGQVRERTLGAFQHQDLPFEKLVEELGVERSLGRTPLFQVMFVLQNNEQGELRLGGAGVEVLERGGPAVKFDLTLSLGEAGSEIRGGLEFRAELWEPATIGRMAGHYLALLAGAAAAPGARLSELQLLGEAERRQLLEEWNRTESGYPAERCIHHLFREQAERTPAAAAVLWQGETTSYAELDRRSSRLAHALRRRGIGPEARVALCLERGVEQVVALLAVLRAGGAYVPLDAAHPADRLAWVLDDAGARVVMTQESLRDRLPASAAEVLCLDADRAEIEAEPAGPPAVAVFPENLAYVIYTSGSTGRPKGVGVQHRSVVNLAHALRRAVYDRRGAESPPRVGMNGPLAFDTSVKQWVQLLSGATLCPVPEEVRMDGAALAGFLRDNAVEVLDCTPAQLRMLESEGLLDRLGPNPTDLLVAGEAIGAPLWRALAGRTDRRAWNLYGPTETTVDAALRRVEGEVPGIGGPVANVRAYVLDPRGEPVPVGVAGELYVGGAGLARGYLGRPDLTAERFVPDAHSAEPGARAYRTGDRVRWLAGGELEFLGRTDAQVKVRGFRIEPGEIEARLAEHPGVRQAVVDAREDGAGERRLVAYVVGDADADALREHLRRRLPEYMVPGAFVALDALPLTPNGKLDRRALPAPERASGGGRSAAPRTPAEEVLAAVWAEVLGLETVGVEEDFFELGGHSLLATRVVSRVREALGVELPLRDLFEAPTVAGLAARVGALRGAGAQAAPPIGRVPRTGPLPASFAQQRLWMVDRLEPGSPAYNMPFALRLRGALDAGALERSLAELVRRHEALRTTLAERGGAPVQVVHPPAPLPLPRVDLRGAADGEARALRLAAEEAARPFDLAAGPLLRGTLLRLGDEDHVLLFTLHHVVGDGWSTEVLTREVFALYAAAVRGEAARLPELPVQYADFAVWQRGWLSGPVLEELIGWWRERLAGAPPLLEIPTDRPRAAGQGALAGSHPLALPAELAGRLRQLARREGATLFMTLLAAWQAVLGRWAGQDDVVVGTPVAGRTRRETEGLIGFFVNMLPLRADLSGDPAWRELLGRVREGALGAYDHQELPFERLVEELGVERSFAHPPVFQAAISLGLSAGGDLPPEPGGLAAEPFGEGARVVKFELDLVFAEGDAGLGGALAFRAALFEPATVARLAGHLQAALEAMSADPGRRLSELSLLRGAERTQVLESWNATATPLPRTSLHELFVEQAARTPGAAAVVEDGREITYAGLERASGRLARRLRALGVGPESRVGVALERGIELAVALLGILRAGGVYLPLDPAYPRERLAYMLADSGAAVLLAPDAVHDALPGFGGARLSPDAEREAIAGGPDGAPESGVDPLNAAYVIYTSGSTGLPKGVVVTHAGAANLLAGAVDTFGARPGDRVAQLASTGFDASLLEIFLALLSGAALHPVGRDVVLSPGRLAELLREREIGILVSTPALLDTLPPDRLPALRAVSTGGDRCSGETAARWSAGRRLLNMYGPTEASIYATWHPCPPGGSEAPPIGRPVANARAYVLDTGGEPAPVGVPGELCLGGAGVARGYLGRPELTADRFVPDPFAGGAGERLYRTGDRARWRGDGTLEFLGRLDAQVKVRGFRVEPGEVEAALLAEPGVREAVVVAREDGPGGTRLVAYLVAGQGTALPAAELRARLRRRLPEHMVPGTFVVLERLPLTPSGKADRRALPAPERAAAEYAAPRTEMEELLCDVWLEVLGGRGGGRLERVGIHDSFFDLGGHSLLAMQLLGRIREALDVQVPPRTLFEAPTVAELAAAVEELLLGALDDAELEEELGRLGLE